MTLAPGQVIYADAPTEENGFEPDRTVLCELPTGTRVELRE